MATLLGTKIKDTYSGLFKTTDNAALGATEKNLTDGEGNASTLSLGTTSASFTGDLDLSGANVTGLPGGAPGLVNGTGSNTYQSLKVADALVNTPAIASSGGNIAIGDAAKAEGGDTFARNIIAIGTNSRGISESSVAVGFNAYTGSDRSVAIGNNSSVTGSRGIAVGVQTSATGFTSLVVGNYSSALAEGAIAIGGYSTYARSTFSKAIGRENNAYASKSIVMGHQSSDADAVRVNSITIGNNINTAQYSINIGNDQNNYSQDSVMVGNNNVIGNNNHVMVGLGNYIMSADNQITIGNGNTSTLANSGAIGYNLTSLWANGITMNQIALANVANINFADDTAAAAGGVPVGGVYHYDGAMRIRIV